jgi:hypothetical protein
MISSETLQGILKTSYALHSVSPDSFELLRKKIYEISMHAFLQDVLTLSRMRSVIQTVSTGLTENANGSVHLAQDTVQRAQRSAYRGLCSASGLGLTAAGLAFTQFSRFHGVALPSETGKTVVRESLALKDQIDQVTRHADWRTNADVIRLQAHGFGQLMQPIGIYAKLGDESLVSWPDRFYQNCGYAPPLSNSNADASLLLLGLLTSGALIGLREAQAVA